MFKQTTFVFLLLSCSLAGLSQDSVWVRLRPKYDSVGSLHRFFFGENYRKEWSDSTYLPIIDLQNVEGGLKPIQLGGGHQTISLRLVSAKGNQWVLRNIEKDASVLLPPEIRQTFAREVIDDAMSAQHPFAPLAVADIAAALNIPHARPVIGMVKNDTFLGKFSKLFAGRVCLLEEREPLGDSDNSLKMFGELDEDNDNSLDAAAFLKARLLDLLISDWDRHPDQWRWVDTRKGKTKYYLGIPRDRDQAFYVNQGIFPGLASRPWFVPSLQGFRSDIRRPKYSLKEGSFLHSRPALHISFDEWMKITREFTAALTDEVLENALRKMPLAAQRRRYSHLLQTLKARRDNIPAAMEKYFRFVNKIVDIQLSNKHEFIRLSGGNGKPLMLDVQKISKSKDLQPLFTATYSPDITKELRLYTGDGNDSILIENHSPIPVRVIGRHGRKNIHVADAEKKVRLYLRTDSVKFTGDLRRMNTKLSDDSLHTAYVPANRYNVFKPMIAAGFNRDDGFLLGLGFQYTRHGFRKLPYASVNRLVLYHSFATSAYRLRYSGEWVDVFGKTDLFSTADIFAPENTQNFFGKGNETPFDKDGNPIAFYRTRFRLYTLTGGFRWTSKTGWNFSAGPSIQHYRFDSSDNRGRILNAGNAINSYDSAIIGASKTHAGLLLNLAINKKNNRVIPSAGYAFELRFHSYAGVNDYSKSFAQLIPEFSVYKALNKSKSLVLADRIGAGFSTGKTTFYQAMFVGGHDNLLGYRQYRFAGEHMLYNNLELRLRLANFTGYIIPGEFGMLGFYDIGRVWIENERSDTWHQGAGGGLYFAPAKLAVLSVVAGYSREGWYPYIKLGFRF